MSKRVQGLLAVLLGSILVFSACGSEAEEAAPAATTRAPAAATTAAPAAATTAAPAATTAAPIESVSVGLVFDIGGRGDGGFNDSAYMGLEQGQNELGASISDASPNSDGSNRAELLRLQADENDLVIGVGFLFADTMTEVAAEYPDTAFGIIDGWVEAPNVASLGFSEHEGSFLVGAAAGLKTEVDTIGFIGGVSIDLIGKFEAGFVAGVAATNPDAKVLVEYISEPPDFSGFNAPDRGREIAQSMYEKGADIVYHAAGGSGAGLFEAAKSFSEESGSKVWAIGVDQDQYTTADEAVREYIMTSMLKRVDVAVFNTIKAVAEGNFVAGGQSFDLAVDGVGYATTGGFIDDIVGTLEDLKAKIVGGGIVVPTTPGERAVVMPDLGGRTITIAIENAYLPFNYIDATTGEAGGWDYDAIDEICARINCVPDYQEFAWDGMIIAVSENNFDLAADGISVTEERSKIVDYSVSYISTDQKILVSKGSTEITSKADLEASDCSVGSQTGTTNYDVAVDTVGEGRVIAFEQFGFAVQAMITGDVCAVIMDDVAGNGYKGENPDDVDLLDEVLAADPLAFIFPKGSDLVSAFDAAIIAMIDDGTMTALAQRYFTDSFTITYDDITDGVYTEEEEASADERCIGLVTDVGLVDDKSFNQASWQGAQEGAEAIGVDVSYIETQSSKDYAANIGLFADAGCDIIVTVGFAMGEATGIAAAEYPDINFIGVDMWQGEALSNVAGLIFNEDRAGFLAGALAASMSSTGIVGQVLGTNLVPPVQAFGNGFDRGARHINPDIEILKTYHPGAIEVAFGDPEWGATTSRQAMDQGADVIFAAGGSTGNGGLMEIAAAASAGESVFCIGVDIDQWYSVPEAKPCLITSAEKHLVQGVSTLVVMAAAGELPSGNYYGTVGLAPYHDFDSVIPDDVKATIDEIAAALNDGSMETGYSFGDE